MKGASFLVFLLWTCSCFTDDYQQRLNCQQINHSWDFQQYLEFTWNEIPLRQVDKYIFLVCCPILLICQLFLLMTMAKYKIIKHNPEDIIFGIFIMETLTNLCLFCYAIYHIIHLSTSPMHSSFPAFCITTGTIIQFSGNCEKIYLFFFLFFIIFNVNKSIKKNKWIKGNAKHFINIIVSGIIVSLYWALEWVGLSQVGICSSTYTRASSFEIPFYIFQTSFAICFVLFALYAYRYFTVHMPGISALFRRKTQDNLLISRFTIGWSIIQALKVVSKIVLHASCENPYSTPNLTFFATIYNFIHIVEFTYFLVVIFLHHKIANKAKKFIRQCFSPKVQGEQVSAFRLYRDEVNEGIDLGLQEKLLDILEQNNEIDFIMVTQIMTMLTGVRTTYRQFLVIQSNLSPVKKLHYSQETSFSVNQKWKIDYEQEALILPRLSFIQSKFTIYAPLVFKHLISKDLLSGVDSSFDLLQNKDKLYKYGEDTGGGRSGEFFFFTKDKKYILKTVPRVEFDNLLEELPLFMEHFQQNPNTLISKIYGMFRIEYTQIDRAYHVLLMKNILGSKDGSLLRMYDMKGSTDDRQVIANMVSSEYSKQKCLKDLDFINIENKLHLGKQTDQFKNQLKKDTSFLQSLNIIDYSLLVMKVQWKEEPEDPYFWSPLQRMQSTSSENVYYHISLIDISQKWDIQKKSEKWWKRFLGKKDTSAQEPSVYKNRFLKFISKISDCSFNDELSSKRTTDTEEKVFLKKYIEMQHLNPAQRKITQNLNAPQLEVIEEQK